MGREMSLPTNLCIKAMDSLAKSKVRIYLWKQDALKLEANRLRGTLYRRKRSSSRGYPPIGNVVPETLCPRFAASYVIARRSESRP